MRCVVGFLIIFSLSIFSQEEEIIVIAERGWVFTPSVDNLSEEDIGEINAHHFKELLRRPIEKRRMNHYYSNMLRASLMGPLHERQIILLKRWRKEKVNNEKAAKETQTEIMLSINALASAMRNTG